MNGRYVKQFKDNLPVSLENVITFLLLHGLSAQTWDYITAAIIFEGKELGSSGASEYIGEVT